MIVPLLKNTDISGNWDLGSTIVVMIVILIPPLLIRFGWYFGGRIVNHIQSAFMAVPTDSGEKPKTGQPLDVVQEMHTLEEDPDYVVGIGDDGELIYASEKPKRKNEEAG